MILRVMDDASLRDEAWAIREEFRTLATDELYNAYIDSKPPSNPRDPGTPAAEVAGMLRTCFASSTNCAWGSLLDVIRAYTTSLTFSITILLVLVTVLVAFLKPEQSSRVPVLLMVAIGGIFGRG